MARLAHLELLFLISAGAVGAGVHAAVAPAHLATRLAALPPLDPGREPFDALGICTSTIEALGAHRRSSLGPAGAALAANLSKR
jgi:hypothetical protein